MAERKKGISHDTAAQLLGIAPGELEALVRAGSIRRNDRNDYAVQILVQDYIEHIRSEGSRVETAPAQAEIAAHLGVSDRLVRELLTKWGVEHKQLSLSEIRLRYINGLREVAAGRATNGDVELATERALLARAQREKVEMDNAERRRLLVKAEDIEPALQAAFTLAREAWCDAVPRVSRLVVGKPAAEVEAALQREFEDFLRHLADWRSVDDEDDDEEGDDD